MNKPAKKGSALLLVLITLAIVTYFSVTLAATMRQKMTLLYRLEDWQTLRQMAMTGVSVAKSVVAEDVDDTYDALTDYWNTSESSFKNISSGEHGTISVENRVDGRTWYGISDEQRKININKASYQVIARLLKVVLGLDQSEADGLAYSIVDWRDEDSASSNPGQAAEDQYYDDLRLAYDCKDAPFETLEELLMVRGVTQVLFDKIKPYITIVGSGEVVNVNTAPRAVLLAIGLSETLVDKILLYRQGADGKEGTVDDFYFPSLSNLLNAFTQADLPPTQLELDVLAVMIDQGKLDVVSTHFLAHSVATITRNNIRMSVDVIFNRKGKNIYTSFSEIQWLDKK